MRNQNNSLKHFGILGMKWGVRKDERTAARRMADEIASDINKKNAISNEDLQKLVNRLNLERQFDELTKADVKRGKSIVGEAAKTVVQTQLIKYGNIALSKFMDSAIKKYSTKKK